MLSKDISYEWTYEEGTHKLSQELKAKSKEKADNKESTTIATDNEIIFFSSCEKSMSILLAKTQNR